MMSDRLASGSRAERTFQDGERIVREGETGHEMFVIQSGAAEVRRRGMSEPVARLGKGDFFGEMAVLESMPRDADVVAVGTTRVLVLGAGPLLVQLRRDPSFALELLQALSGRVRRLNEQLRALGEEPAVDAGR